MTSRELNLPFQMPSFLYHRIYASSLGYKYNELKYLILHKFGETSDILLMQVCYTLSAIGRILGSWCRHSIGEISIFDVNFCYSTANLHCQSRKRAIDP